MPLYSFTSATFTPGAASGRNGPTLAQAVSGLTSTGVDAWKNNTAYFNTSNGIQLWTVPATGLYTIDCYGAQGGNAGSQQGGLGARIKGTFSLTEGEIIRILVGQQGQSGAHTQDGQPMGAGGGGTYVIRTPYNTTPSILTIAGGGGGASQNAYTTAAGLGASAGNNGVAGQGGKAGGTSGGGGDGGSGDGSGPGGAGFTGNGLVDPLSGNQLGDNAKSFTNGGVGGRKSLSWGGVENYGGFGGGGGGGGLACGGGGGYSGGGGGTWSSQLVGGGGGSYNAGTDQTNTAATRTGAGYVVITSTVLPDGLSANSQSAASGETLTITFTSATTADNTLVPYTITGVNSSDINGASLTGNFTIVNKTASVSFLISTSANKTFTITSNGFTQTVSLLENRYGLVVLNETASITSTFRDLPIVNLTSVGNLTTINVLNIDNQFKFSFNQDSVIKYTSANDYNLIDLSSSTSTSNLLSITILTPDNLYKNAVQQSSSVDLTGKVFYSVDFFSITDFNVPEPIPLTFPERWAG